MFSNVFLGNNNEKSYRVFMNGKYCEKSSSSYRLHNGCRCSRTDIVHLQCHSRCVNHRFKEEKELLEVL